LVGAGHEAVEREETGWQVTRSCGENATRGTCRRASSRKRRLSGPVQAVRPVPRRPRPTQSRDGRQPSPLPRDGQAASSGPVVDNMFGGGPRPIGSAKGKRHRCVTDVGSSQPAVRPRDPIPGDVRAVYESSRLHQATLPLPGASRSRVAGFGGDSGFRPPPRRRHRRGLRHLVRRHLSRSRRSSPCQQDLQLRRRSHHRSRHSPQRIAGGTVGGAVGAAPDRRPDPAGLTSPGRAVSRAGAGLRPAVKGSVPGEHSCWVGIVAAWESCGRTGVRA